MINRKLFREVIKNLRYMACAALYPLVTGVLILVYTSTFGAIMNGVIILNKSVYKLMPVFAIFMLAFLLRSFSGLIFKLTLKKLSYKTIGSIIKRLYNRVSEMSPVELSDKRGGELVNIIGNGTDMLIPYYSEYIPQFFSALIIPLMILAAAFKRDIFSGVIMLVTYPLIPLFMFLIGSKAKEESHRQWDSLNRLSGHFLEVLRSLRLLKHFDIDRLQEDKIYSISEEFRKTTMKVLRVSFLSAFVLELAGTISTAVIAVNLGLKLVFKDISFVDAFTVILLAPEFYLPMRQLGLKFHASANGDSIAEEIYKIDYKYNKDDESRLSDTQSIESISIINAGYTYRDSEAEINNINIELIRGKTTALVGESGSGKSTILYSLMKFIDIDEGNIYFNDISIKNIKAENLRKRISYVPQRPRLFRGNLRYNLLFGDDVKDQHRFDAICSLIGISEIANRLENGYDTLVGEGSGISLSGGEVQRIAAARALLKDSDILLLDEPTASLDAENQSKLMEAVKNFAGDRIVVITAHRLVTIKDADEIVVIESGRITERGDHKSLMENNGFYQKLVRLQGVEY